LGIQISKIYALIVKNTRSIAQVFSFGLLTYKSLDYRHLYLTEVALNDLLESSLSERRDENDDLMNTYNNVLITLSMDSYNINDIKLPLWYLIYDEAIEDFRMVKFNKAYEEVYGNKPGNYFAKTTQEVSGDIGEEWAENNRETLKSPTVRFFFERYINKEGHMGIGRFAKWIVKKNERTYLYGVQTEL